MSAGPLRRTVAVLGILALLPILAQMASGAITPEDAAVRALAVGVATIALGNLTRMFLRGTLRRVEQDASESGSDALAGQRHDRRASDRQDAAAS